MRKKFLTLCGVIGVAGVAAYWYLSPYLAIHQMRSAIRAGDAETLNEYVDYPKLRESLKGQLSARIAGQIAPQPSGDAFERAGAALGTMLGMSMMDRMVDVFVRPEAVMLAMQEGKFSLGQSRSGSAERETTAAQVDISTISQALRLYKLDHGSFPTQEQGLAVLVDPSADRTYLEHIPMDPWGRPYQYANPGKEGEIDVYHLPVPDKAASGARAERTEVQWSATRKGMDKLIVYVRKDAEPDAQRDTGLVLERDGFARWKMTEIRLPKDAN